jgi:hypothetical protein
LIGAGTAPGQAETFDYSSKMAANKEAAAAAAAKVGMFLLFQGLFLKPVFWFQMAGNTW